jgi:hypothetical protein
MTEESLKEGIRRLIIARRNASPEEEERINTKLTKLYDLQEIMYKQNY